MKHNFLILVIALIFGTTLSIQAKSFKDVSSLVARDTHANVFREIQILKDTNRDLATETVRLTETLQETSNREKALNAIEKEIALYRMLAGEIDIEGSGISISISSKLTSALLIDLVNELLTSGAERIAINGLHVTGLNIGFDVSPNRQIILGGNVITEPFVVEAIGDSKEMENALLNPYGIIARMEHALKTDISVARMERIVMKKVL